MVSLAKLLGSSPSNFTSYGISPARLTFRDVGEEAEFRKLMLQSSVAHIRFALAFGLILIVLYGVLDVFIYRDSSTLTRALIIRCFLIFAPVLALLVVTFIDAYNKYNQLAGIAIILIVGIGWCLFSIPSKTLFTIYNFPAVIMTSIYSFFFVGNLFMYAFPSALFINVLYCIAIWSSIDMPIVMKMSVTTSMLVILLLLAMAAYQKELISRQLFVTEIREGRTLARQALTDRRNLDWLRQLARFLRHEVRQPVAQIMSSIELLQLTAPHSDDLKRHFENATLGTQQVWGLIDRASRATDAEAFVRQGHPEDIRLDELLSGTVEGFRRSSGGIAFDLTAREPVRVNADATLLQEAVGNLLSNAASFADEDSVVKIALEKTETHAFIRVVNRGPLLPTDDPEALFELFSSSRSGPASEHQGLGLYLVKIIAEHHDGTATLRNLPDRSGVEAVIALPLYA